MSAMQWALLVAGLAVVGLVYWYSRRDLGDGAGGPSEEDRGQIGLWDTFGDQFDEFGVGKARTRSAPGLDDDAPDAVSEEAKQQLIVFYLVERENAFIPGTHIHQSMDALKMQFGHRHIYHRIKEVGGVPQEVFSIASIAKPGYLDPQEAESFSTPGLVVFMNLPGPEHPEGAFDDMLRTTRKLSEWLKADILDDRREPLTDERVEALLRDARLSANPR